MVRARSADRAALVVAVASTLLGFGYGIWSLVGSPQTKQVLGVILLCLGVTVPTLLMVLDKLNAPQWSESGIEFISAHLDIERLAEQWRTGRNLLIVNNWLQGYPALEKHALEALGNRGTKVEILLARPDGAAIRARAEDFDDDPEGLRQDSLRSCLQLRKLQDDFPGRVTIELYCGSAAFCFYGLEDRGLVGFFWRKRHAMSHTHFFVRKGDGCFAENVFAYIAKLRATADDVDEWLSTEELNDLPANAPLLTRRTGNAGSP